MTINSVAFRNAVAQKGVSYSALARQTGVDKKRIGQFTKANKPVYLYTVGRLAKALNVPVETLIIE